MLHVHTCTGSTTRFALCFATQVYPSPCHHTSHLISNGAIANPMRQCDEMMASAAIDNKKKSLSHALVSRREEAILRPAAATKPMSARQRRALKVRQVCGWFCQSTSGHTAPPNQYRIPYSSYRTADKANQSQNHKFIVWYALWTYRATFQNCILMFLFSLFIIIYIFAFILYGLVHLYGKYDQDCLMGWDFDQVSFDRNFYKAFSASWTTITTVVRLYNRQDKNSSTLFFNQLSHFISTSFATQG